MLILKKVRVLVHTVLELYTLKKTLIYTHLIKVGTGASTCDVYGGVRSASYNSTTKQLIIVNESGETLTLNFADVASAEGVNSLLATLRTSIDTNSADIATLKGTGAGSISQMIATEDSSVVAYAGRTYSTKTELSDAVAELEVADSSIQSDVDDIASKLNTLIGEDDGKSARSISAEEVAKIVADASTSYDTLKEISDWIISHGDSAAAMNSAISDNAAALAILNGNDTTSGSVAKAAKDTLASANSYTDTEVSSLSNKFDSSLGELSATVDSAVNAFDEVISVIRGTGTGSIRKAAEDASTAAYTNAAAYADSLAGNYATAAQGTKADDAVQSVNGKSGNAVTVNASDINLNLTSGQSFNYLTSGMSVEGALEALDVNVHEAIASAGVTSLAGATGAITLDTAPTATNAVTFAMSGTKITGTVKNQALSTATSALDGVATAYDVKTYVDTAVSNAKLQWDLFE